ncbi:transcriptional regulator [Idiomarina tyrosinivorans]|uniref:Glycine cleavage system transcriptional repressor n=1 Tax=Idiomarina tyrosinivorans TaxID=1445662 RepID=A0A432ZU46_9GAMM|nr:ACT domain-containing protein [Idiomarina tyrosinivorans]RUO81465.1 transcriptional regulator [Idiomarina tyrosinivorans]
MNQQLIVTAMGENRAGLVSDLTQLIHQQGGNIVDSRMAQFGEEFLITLLLAGDPAIIDRLEVILPGAAAEMQLLTMTKRTRPRAPVNLAHIVHVKLQGNDAPGVLAGVSALLAERDVNIVTLRSDSIGKDSQHPLHISMNLDVPERTSTNDLKQALQAYCAEQQIQCRFIETDSSDSDHPKRYL